MFALRCTRAAPTVTRVALRSRTLATPVTNLPTTSTGALPTAASSNGRELQIYEGAAEGALRPHLKVEVNPNHGLYGFFRKTEKDGETVYETVEPDTAKTTKTGRSWTAKELRLKSFKDLHTLWYVLVRERNLLATQAEESRRLKIRLEQISSQVKISRCRKSMARIKYVINERRLAYELEVQKLQQEREVELAERAQAQATLDAVRKMESEEAARKAERAARKLLQPGENEKAAQAAAAGLFESTPQVEQQKA